ncbi:tannase and feruloyl esterase [Hypoxylon crocopeplum]|nr:tannase and feruloyl esterase [Hypoxylon crocopeplum]
MASNSLAQACVPSTFDLAVFGAEVLSLQASVITNYSVDVPSAYRYTAPSVTLENATFCNVTVTYTHPGQNDSINAEAWLPIDNWNERFQAVGGGGWIAGRFFLSYAGMAGALNDGYATITTDAGLGGAYLPTPWALLSPGNVDLYKLQNLGSVSLNDEAIIGKSLVESFYGKPPSYSYWNGCSQGGRQGLMLAQRYPTAYDGIAAGAPAIYWTGLTFTTSWPEQFMHMLGEYPYNCELDALTAAAVSKCDGLDGVTDGIIAEVDECMANFDPFDLVSTTITCAQTNTTMPISHAAAAVANATWGGIISSTGERLWHGLGIGADLTGNSPKSYGQPGIAATNCTSSGCVPVTNTLGSVWIQLFLAKDPDFNISSMTHEQFDNLFHASKQQYNSMVGTDDPNLSAFKKAGGKMITFHGLADNVIPTKGTEQYYRKVSKMVDNIEDFYRYFPVPGLGHCFGGYGAQPTSLFAQLQAWVEDGTVPENSPISFPDLDGVTQNRIICPWPQKAQFDSSCGDSTKTSCWMCLKPENHEELFPSEEL